MSFFSKGKPALGWVMGLALMYWAQGGDAAQLAAFETPPFNPGERLVLDAQELKWIKDNPASSWPRCSFRCTCSRMSWGSGAV